MWLFGQGIEGVRMREGSGLEVRCGGEGTLLYKKGNRGGGVMMAVEGAGIGIES